MQNELKLYPLWKQAVTDFLKLNPEPGHVLTREWLVRQFELSEPETAADFKRFSLDFLQAFSAFQETLLEMHQIALKTIPGVGYEVVAPQEQTKFGEALGLKLVARGLRKWVQTNSNVKLEALTHEQRRENAESLARAASLRTFAKQRGLQDVSSLKKIGR